MNNFSPSSELYLTETPVPNNGYSLVGIELPVQGRRRGQQRSFTPLSGRNLPAGVALSPTRRGEIIKRFSNLTEKSEYFFPGQKLFARLSGLRSPLAGGDPVYMKLPVKIILKILVL